LWPLPNHPTTQPPFLSLAGQAGAASPDNLNLILRSFLCAPKEKNQKKGRPVPLARLRRVPCAPRSCREFANSPPAGAQTVQTPFAAAAAVLGCVPMGYLPEKHSLGVWGHSGGSVFGRCSPTQPLTHPTTHPPSFSACIINAQPVGNGLVANA
jgi:hypothetical protein